jgi:hypothetical protein
MQKYAIRHFCQFAISTYFLSSHISYFLSVFNDKWLDAFGIKPDQEKLFGLNENELVGVLSTVESIFIQNAKYLIS